RAGGGARRGGVRDAPLLRHLQVPPEPAHLLAHRARRIAVLRGGIRSREAAVRPLRDPVRHFRPRRLGRERRRVPAVPVVDLLHGVRLSAGGRGGGDLRPDADAAPAAGAARMSPPPPPVDLRSDRVTKPSREMRRAMADALFFPSGTQANQTGIALLTRPGIPRLAQADVERAARLIAEVLR